VSATALLPGRDAFVVLASDGLWDVMTDGDAVAVASAAVAALGRREGAAGGGGTPPPAEGEGRGGRGAAAAAGAAASGARAARAARAAADALLHEALGRGTLDNVTVVVMLLEWRAEGASACEAGL